MKKVICIGSASKDIFILLNETKIKENSKSLTEKKLMSFEFGAKIYAERLAEEVGGSAVNVAAGLNLGGARSFVFSRTKKDEVGKWIQKRIGKLKIKKNYMQSRGAEQSAISAIISDKKNLDHTIIRTGDSVEWFDLDKSLKKFREKVDWIYIGSLKKGSVEKIAKIVEFANNKKADIAFVPSGFQIKNDIKELQEYFDKFKLVFLNRDEAIEILQNLKVDFNDDPKDLIEKLYELGFSQVALTDGAEGAYVGNKKEIFYLPIAEGGVKKETVGAGDAFASGFMSRFIENEDIRRSLSWGMVNSAAVLSRIGATKGLLTKKEMTIEAEKEISKIKKIK